MQISRLFQMLYILLERERVSAPELAKILEVSVRTVYRDMQTLCEAGVPLYAQRGRDGGIAILPGYSLNKSMLTHEERASLLAALTASMQSGLEDKDSLGKLRAFFGSDSADWVQIDFSDWSGEQDDMMPVIRRAILTQRILSFDYYGEAGHPRARRVCPLKLWFRGQAWYLRAYCLDRQALRVFKLTRLKRAQIVVGEFPEAAHLTRESDVPTHNWTEPQYIHLVLRIDSRMAYRVYDDFSERSITQNEDGSFIIDTMFPPGAWIKSVVMGYGEYAEVLSPPQLRTEIKQTLENMQRLYHT